MLVREYNATLYDSFLRATMRCCCYSGQCTVLFCFDVTDLHLFGIMKTAQRAWVRLLVIAASNNPIAVGAIPRVPALALQCTIRQHVRQTVSSLQQNLVVWRSCETNSIYVLGWVGQSTISLQIDTTSEVPAPTLCTDLFAYGHLLLIVQTKRKGAII